MQMYRLVFSFLSFIFVIFALLQINDPDGLIWVMVYLSAALVHWEASRKNFYFVFSALACVSSLACVFLLWPSDYQGVAGVMRTELPQIEQARESLGMLIVFISLCIVLFASRRVKKTKA